MASSTNTVVEHCEIAPSPDAAPELVLPLLYFDVVCLPFTPLEHLVFYAFPCSQSHFSDTIVPDLKHSLSITLKHFLPLAGKIIFPLHSQTTMPVSHYVAGDSISLTIAQSDADLTLLMAGNLSRDADLFHDLIGRFPPPIYSPESINFSVAAIKVTLFPEQGICFGITNHHAVCDGSAILQFLHIWASIAKFKGDTHLLPSSSGKKLPLPFYDRSRVQDADTLTKTCWDLMKMSSPVVSSANALPTNKVRATFFLSEAEIQNLKNSILEKKPSMAKNLSSFTIVCAHVWASLARSAGDDVADDDETEYFTFVADIRGRLDPPLPQTYFGNCLAFVLAESTRGRLKGDRGIAIAAEAILEAIEKTVNSENGVLDGLVERLLEVEGLQRDGKRIVWISGSPRFSVYVADFGWGGPKSYELVNIDSTGTVFLAKSRESERGVEITLSKPKAEMDAFAPIFNHGLIQATGSTFNQVSKL